MFDIVYIYTFPIVLWPGSCCDLREFECKPHNRGLNNKCFDDCMCEEGGYDYFILLFVRGTREQDLETETCLGQISSNRY